MNIGLLILRAAIGLTLAVHGSQKLFGWFGGGGITGTGSVMEMLGFRPGRLHAILAGLTEFGGGLFLAAGFLTPLAASAVIGVMTVAAVSAHWGKGFFLQNGGFEYTFVLAASALGIAFAGPGALSLDRALAISWSGARWGLAALVLGLATSGLQLLMRKTALGAATRKTA
jgi:putative oxidoreductase